MKLLLTRLGITTVIPLLVIAVLLEFPGGYAVAKQSPQVTQVSIVPGAALLTTTAYSPDVVTVVIGVNNTVVWTNNDPGTPHTATGTNNTAFDTGTINSGGTGNYTFTTPGTYPYHCFVHPTTMKGEVIVKAAATTTTSAGGGGIPEFPLQLVGAAIFTVLIVTSYLLVRRSQVLNPLG